MSNVFVPLRRTQKLWVVSTPHKAQSLLSWLVVPLPVVDAPAVGHVVPETYLLYLNPVFTISDGSLPLSHTPSMAADARAARPEEAEKFEPVASVLAPAPQAFVHVAPVSTLDAFRAHWFDAPLVFRPAPTECTDPSVAIPRLFPTIPEAVDPVSLVSCHVSQLMLDEPVIVARMC